MCWCITKHKVYSQFMFIFIMLVQKVYVSNNGNTLDKIPWPTFSQLCLKRKQIHITRTSPMVWRASLSNLDFPRFASKLQYCGGSVLHQVHSSQSACQWKMLTENKLHFYFSLDYIFFILLYFELNFATALQTGKAEIS